ncbi:histidine kinase [Campylobacter sp. MIT 99-7217]|uniref:PAS domain-containing protein n=1 Tax=Campylobacter sp. MIT 99-7217 TaxID=535091 RepID=UPI001156E88E|nr:PAS domain-containing protein [Campylobacter sp. MIT 99-7217]TQR34536.1 histidine kinase [Campylobacter sp. MIT 99-7217]
MNQQIYLEADTLITSKTDTKGFITYANDDFIKYSGYKLKDLLFKNHNILRHPDMPKIAYKALWEQIQGGKEFFAFVKNKTKENDFYWVFANITPSFDMNKNIIGYYSVRRAPNLEAVKLIETIYTDLINIEKKEGMKGSAKALFDIVRSYKMSYNELIFRLQENSL